MQEQIWELPADAMSPEKGSLPGTAVHSSFQQHALADKQGSQESKLLN